MSDPIKESLAVRSARFLREKLIAGDYVNQLLGESTLAKDHTIYRE